MTDYTELVKELRYCANATTCRGCYWLNDFCLRDMKTKAADAIEGLLSDYQKLYDKHVDLLRAAKAMHTWIFLHTVDEQAAYDECHLSDEMNMALGYGGRFEIAPKEDTDEP